MIIVLRKGATQKDLQGVVEEIERAGLKAHISKGTERTLIGAVGDERVLSAEHLQTLPGVEKVLPILKPFKLASKEFHPEPTIVEVNGVKIGGNKLTIIAGPCAIENEDLLMRSAKYVKDAGADVFRGSAYKPRTSPYDFQGLGEPGLKLLKKVREKFGMPVETEVMDTRHVELVAKYVDIVRVGARNMQNFELLKEVGKIDKPVILKNGLSSTIKEFLMAAEYIMSEGNHNVILCYRGIRTFETDTRFTLDLGAIPVLKANTHLPVLVDPSHAMGKKDFVPAMSKAAIAAGADGLLIEVHCDPSQAKCDAAQQIVGAEFGKLMGDLRKVAEAVGRKI